MSVRQGEAVASKFRTSAQTPKMRIQIYFPGYSFREGQGRTSGCLAQVSVERTGKIEQLQPQIQTFMYIEHPKRVSFIWNGIALMDTETFGSYGIQEKDIIVSIPADTNDSSKWLTLTRDSESFSDRIASVMDQSTAKEASRLRDFQITRMERKPRTYRRLITNYERAMTESPVTSRSTEKFVTKMPQFTLAAPSVDPLPIIWDTDGDAYEVTTTALSVVKDVLDSSTDRENETIRN